MADCSKTEDFVKERERMCYTCGGCVGCSFNSENNGYGYQCEDYVNICTKEAVQALQKWSDSHPESKTYADDFFEKFPNAPKEDGIPMCCRASVYGDGSCDERYTGLGYENECIPCWNEPYEEK